jgi:hypothetical protein
MAGLAVSLQDVNGLFAAASGNFVYQSDFIKLEFSADSPRLLYFSTDSLGKGQFAVNPLLPPEMAGRPAYFSQVKKHALYYYPDADKKQAPVWEVHCDKKKIEWRTRMGQGQVAPPFDITFSQRRNHCTVLGITTKEKQVQFPCLLHLPGMGTFRIHCNQPGVTLYYDAYRFGHDREKGEPYVKMVFPGANEATADITYTMESIAICPDWPVLKNDARFEGVRRNFINIFQLNPRIQALANNSASDACAFTLFLYAEMARKTPALAPGLTAMDLVRHTLDQYLAGMKAYGQVGYNGYGWQSEYDSCDSAPSLIIAAAYYIIDTKDTIWAGRNYEGIKAWAIKMIATDKDNDGLIEYGYSGNANSWSGKFKRPANWWDTIGFGHHDAYSNALAYHACMLLVQVASLVNKKEDSEYFSTFARKLKTSYYNRFYNPATGVLAGWQSEDGQLHDYYFTFVNAVAVVYGLIDVEAGKKIMQTLLHKMKEAGYTNFKLGLPGNLVPVADADYTHHDPRWGYQKFQVYENGGATACYAYFTIQALFNLNMREEAQALLFPMLESFKEGGFEGHCTASEMTKDWKTWTGECWGYEGFLVDNYLTLLAAQNL